MRSYTFPVEIEVDEDRWFVRVPSLEHAGAATWGHSRDEALRNIQEVAQLVIESLIEDGHPLPADIRESESPVVSVNV